MSKSGRLTVAVIGVIAIFGVIVVIVIREWVRSSKLDELQGVWKQTNLETGGKLEGSGDFTLTIKGDAFKQTSISNLHRTISVEAGRIPMVMRTHGARTRLGGEDTVTEMFELSDAELILIKVPERHDIPKSFGPLPADGSYLTRWRRAGAIPDRALPVGDRLGGEWEMSELIIPSGKRASLSKISTRMRINGDRCVIVVTVERNGKFSLGGKTKDIDLLYDDYPLVKLGLFELTGKDQLVLSEPFKPNERPANFSTSGKTHDSTRIFQRIAP